jgi:hypothetical protein
LIQADPLPRSLAQSAVYAVETLSLLLLSALREDPSGLAQHHAGAVVCSLLALELAILDHEDLVKRAVPLGAVNTSNGNSLLSLSGYTGDYYAAQTGGYQGYGGLARHRMDVAAALSPDLRAVRIATEEALNRLVRGYRDVLVTYTFPKIYADALQAKVAALSLAL